MTVELDVNATFSAKPTTGVSFMPELLITEENDSFEVTVELDVDAPFSAD